MSSATREMVTTANRLAVAIGGFSFGISGERNLPIALDREHHAFVIPAESKRACDIEVEISSEETLELPRTQPSFVSGGLWSAYRDAIGSKFYFVSPALGEKPYKAAWFDANFERGHIVLNRSCFAQDEPVFPLEYPVDELVMMHRLSLGEGVEVHALGVMDEDESGYLFLGHSGDGKSTTARLWQDRPGVRLLSDDRIILRKHGRDFWMYGTPWHGDAGVASPLRARLHSLFLLEQAPVNELLPVAPARAAAELFARSFVPHYIESGIQFTLSFLDGLTRAVPASIFRFLPESSAVEAIRHGCA